MTKDIISEDGIQAETSQKKVPDTFSAFTQSGGNGKVLSPEEKQALDDKLLRDLSVKLENFTFVLPNGQDAAFFSHLDEHRGFTAVTYKVVRERPWELHGKHVIVVGMDDEPGRVDTQQIVAMCKEGKVASVKTWEIEQYGSQWHTLEDWNSGAWSLPDDWVQDDDQNRLIRCLVITRPWEVNAACDLPLKTTNEVKPFSLEIVSSQELCGSIDAPKWLVKGVMIAGQPTIVGGPMKTLKTSILIDLTVSLATGTPFLGRFEVPRQTRCCLISGESGRYVIRANAKEIGWARGLDVDQDQNISWGFTLPMLTEHEHLKAIEKLIRDNGIEAIMLDPFYLMLPGQVVDVKNMFSLGPVLDIFGKLCLDAGCLPVLSHHFTKSRENPTAPPELHELAYGGVSQWMRQWLMVSRREPYDATSGIHKLHWRHGGSFGHSGELSLDIETGVVDENFKGRKWIVTANTVSQRIADQDQDQQAKAIEREMKRYHDREAINDHKTREDMAKAIKIFEGQSDRRLTKNKLRELTHWDSVRVGHVLYRLEQDGFIRKIEYDVIAGKGAIHRVEGYELV